MGRYGNRGYVSGPPKEQLSNDLRGHGDDVHASFSFCYRSSPPEMPTTGWDWTTRLGEFPGLEKTDLFSPYGQLFHGEGEYHHYNDKFPGYAMCRNHGLIRLAHSSKPHPPRLTDKNSRERNMRTSFFCTNFFEHPQGSGTSRQNSRDIPESSLRNPRKRNFRGRARTFRPPSLCQVGESPDPKS